MVLLLLILLLLLLVALGLGFYNGITTLMAQLIRVSGYGQVSLLSLSSLPALWVLCS